MTNKLCFFVFEASLSIGAGHAIRSLVLAEILEEKGYICKIITSKNNFCFIKKLTDFECIDRDFFYNSPVLCDYLFFDDYNVDQKEEIYYKPFAKKIIVIDDLANRNHACDILLDQTYKRNMQDYIPFTSSSCKILTGSKYALLRKEFLNQRPHAIERRKFNSEVRHILISLGGFDPDNNILKVIKIIEKTNFKGVVDVVLGFSNENLKILNEYCKSLSFTPIFHENSNMPLLIYKADIAIGAAGSSMWERCCLGLPTLMFVLSYDQIKIAEQLSAAGIAINLGSFEDFDLMKAATVLNNLIHNNFLRKKMQDKAFNICNGQGANLVIGEIDDLY